MLIIYAHPNKLGHSGKILQEVISFLNKKNQEYKILDLYEMNYNPILSQAEHYTSGNKNVSDENKKIQELIKNNNQFIFIYPTWWNNMPAILKGFIDRVFVSGFAFRYEGKFPKKLLTGKALVFSTTGGPRIFSKFIVGDRALKVLKNDVLGFCGIKAKGYSIDGANQLNDKQLMKIGKTVGQGMSYFDN